MDAGERDDGDCLKGAACVSGAFFWAWFAAPYVVWDLDCCSVLCGSKAENKKKEPTKNDGAFYGLFFSSRLFTIVAVSFFFDPSQSGSINKVLLFLFLTR